MKFILIFLILSSVTTGWAGSVELGTYYPAPFGNYDRLKLAPRTNPGTPCDPGTMYVDNTAVTLQFCAANGTWAPGLWTKNAANLYPADNSVNVGIGTTTPSGKLTISNTADTSDLAVGNLDFARTRIDFLNADTAAKARIQSESGGTDASLDFYTENSGVLAKRMIIDPGDTFVGIGTSTPEFRLSIDNDGGIIAKGTFGSGANLATTGAGTRLIWYPRRAAFRAGNVTGTEWDDTVANPNIGDYSVAMGNAVTASGTYSTATGNATTASGNSSIAMGFASVASGQNAIVLGTQSTASGSNSISIGRIAAATGKYATAMGFLTNAQSYGSMAIGQSNIDSGDSLNWNAPDPLFVIGNGNGISGNPGQYANALTVLKNGNVGIGTTNPGTNRLEVTGGNIKATGGIIMETRTTNPTGPVAGQVWLCTGGTCN